MKNKKLYCLSVLLLPLVLSVSGCSQRPPGTDATADAAATVTDDESETTADRTSTAALSVPMTVDYAAEDLDDSWDAAAASVINFQGDTVSISGSGLSANGTTVTISAAGTYICSGTLDDGQLLIDADKNSLVRLIFDGVDLTCSSDAPVRINKASKAILTLAPGSVNRCTDARAYAYDADSDEPDAAIYSKKDLTINGSGELIVTAAYRNGIASKDNLVITDGDISVQAVHDAIRGKDSLAICGGTFTIAAGADGLKSHNSSDEEKGWIALAGGTYDIQTGNDGIQAETLLQITAGTFAIEAGGGSGNTSYDTASSAKGLKAGSDLYIADGTFQIDAADDTLHSDGNVQIDGGSLLLTSGDDGIHADTALIVNDGDITISQSYEGLEGYTVDINGGNIDITASDDGINAAGGTDSSQAGGRFGGDNFSAGGSGESDSDGTSIYIRISGGTLLVNAAGDGLDSNADLYIDGGITMVSGSTSSRDAAVDFDGTGIITGGILIAAGSSGMAQAPGASSTQPVMTVTYDSYLAAETEIIITDADGSELYSFTPPKEYNHLVFSHPELTADGAYTVTAGTIETALSLSDVVTTVAQDGSEASGRGFGGGNPPGAGGRGGSSPREDRNAP